MYRWHIADPVRFESDLRVNVQDLGWGDNGGYKMQKSNISTVAFWYQREPHSPFPPPPSERICLLNNLCTPPPSFDMG